MVGSAERRPTEDRCDLSSRIAKTMRDPQSRINDQAALRTRTRRRGPSLALGMTEKKDRAKSSVFRGRSGERLSARTKGCRKRPLA